MLTSYDCLNHKNNCDVSDKIRNNNGSDAEQLNNYNDSYHINTCDDDWRGNYDNIMTTGCIA